MPAGVLLAGPLAYTPATIHDSLPDRAFIRDGFSAQCYMSNHLAALGFRVETMADVESLTDRALAVGQTTRVGGGSYVTWSLRDSGVQLWYQLGPGGEVLGMSPHFDGYGLMRVRLNERVHRPDDTALEGGFHAWANPDGGVTESGDYPFVFEAPDFRTYDALEMPCPAAVQLTAFAHELHAYGSDGEFLSSQEGNLKVDSESFISTGLFGGESAMTSLAYAFLSGHVLHTELIINPETWVGFHWALVRTLGGELDVVAEPEVMNGQLVQGGVVSGSFWLSGRLLDYPGQSPVGRAIMKLKALQRDEGEFWPEAGWPGPVLSSRPSAQFPI